MLRLWLQDIESLEAISQNDEAKQIFLRMAARVSSFLTELAHDQELDDETMVTLSELARDHSFLLAVEDYLRRTQILH